MSRPDPQINGAILAHLRKIHAMMCRRWFDDIEAVDLSGGTLSLLVKEPVQLRYLQRRCLDQFTEAAQAVTGRLLGVRFVGEDEASALRRAARTQESNGKARTAITKASWAPDETLDTEMLISPDYSFGNFVIGPGNRLAHAAAMAVSKKPGCAYNPLFFHGGVGLGKTHLLQAICQATLAAMPHLRLHYTSCDGFMTQFLDAVQAGEMADFRHRFRTVDILLIDDIHDLSRRDRTQEEFFHTFNCLYQSGKQIVLSSDAAPRDIPDLEERLVSRFNCGLVAEIEKPGFETRVAILKAKAALRQVSLPDDVATLIATRIDSNIRELEGAITKIVGLASISGAGIDLNLAKRALGEEPGRSQTHLPTIQRIIDTVTDYYGVRASDLLSKRRHKSIALPRQVCMWLARKHTGHSLEEIGGYFGGRDHTTVMHAVKTINTKREIDQRLDHNVSTLEQQLLHVA